MSFFVNAVVILSLYEIIRIIYVEICNFSPKDTYYEIWFKKTVSSATDCISARSVSLKINQL